MCDFRKTVAVIIGNEVTFNPEVVGHFYTYDCFDQTPEPGLYTVGASGVGLYYFNGQDWYSDYDDSFTKTCRFVTEDELLER